ncbi:MAG TPA: GNAT family N-acetyltransferase [Bryobacteraceae bacterium]|nr:GNAT family N-acetyltransferase [Bryobacteraceae bacterium]
MAPQAVLAGEGVSEGRETRIVDLRDLRAGDLDPLLREQTEEWAHELDWDFSKSADLLRQLFDARELAGLALLDGRDIAGFAYCGFSSGKAHVGDVYVPPPWRNGNAETVLFQALFNVLMDAPGVERIEAQLMLARQVQPPDRDCRIGSFERLFMTRDAAPSLPPGNASNTSRFRFEPWEDRHSEAAAFALWQAHAGHVDAQISDQYRTLAASSRFIQELVRFPGCASFCPSASYVAFENATGHPAGISLISFVAPGIAHLAELCVTPEFRGAGLGYELLRQSSAALADAGAQRISLTVTAGNDDALRLYRRCGFRQTRRFYAYAWDRSARPAFS